MPKTRHLHVFIDLIVFFHDLGCVHYFVKIPIFLATLYGIGDDNRGKGDQWNSIFSHIRITGIS